ncbi:MAG: T9SS type A sorting domain-containing protein [Bacteroidetes bacterium]|nr:T9SS type A sorting domain-containing protein [Bacteroidota bacterium]
MTDKNAIHINDVLGNVVCEWNNINTSTPSLDVSKLSKGIYFITIENENGLSVMRVMKTY